MTDFILLLIFGACYTWGIHCLFSSGFALARIGNMLRTELNTSPETYGPTWLTKPLFDCPPCMASIHGFSISAIYFGWPFNEVPAYMICLCGLNFVIKSILYPEYE